MIDRLTALVNVTSAAVPTGREAGPWAEFAGSGAELFWGRVDGDEAAIVELPADREPSGRLLDALYVLGRDALALDL